MTHRADQVIEAAAALIETQVASTGVKVYTHRRYSLVSDMDELPAISVDFGADEIVGEETLSYIDSMLSVVVTGVSVGDSEEDVRKELLEFRRAAHVAFMADVTLGLSFVIAAHYAGASEPEIDASGDIVIGAMASSWETHYRMNFTDPGDD